MGSNPSWLLRNGAWQPTQLPSDRFEVLGVGDVMYLLKSQYAYRVAATDMHTRELITVASATSPTPQSQATTSTGGTAPPSRKTSTSALALPHTASAAGKQASVAAVLNLGSGSGIYDRSFRDPAVFDSLLVAITREVASTTQRTSVPGRLTLSGFSAGHGAIRAIIGEPRHEARVHAILLLDGMHTSYVPEGRVLDAGGALDSTNLVAFAHFARAARQGDKRFLVTHSEIFPGTFASTTETAEWLLRASGVKRRAVLRWGPRGMQQLSEAHDGRFTLLGYAGNSAPDHIDQFHAMPELLARLLK